MVVERLQSWQKIRKRPIRFSPHGRIEANRYVICPENDRFSSSSLIVDAAPTGLIDKTSVIHEPPQYSQNVWLLSRQKSTHHDSLVCRLKVSLRQNAK